MGGNFFHRRLRFPVLRDKFDGRSHPVIVATATVFAGNIFCCFNHAPIMRRSALVRHPETLVALTIFFRLGKARG